MTWRALAAAMALALLMVAAQPAHAFITLPPDPLLIRFDTATGDLTPDGRLAADRLAVRAAQCREGRLRVLMHHAPGIRPDQVTARYRAVRQRLSRLGIAAIYVDRFAGSGDGTSAAGAWASVSSGDDQYCSQVDSPLLQRWVDQVAGHAKQPAGRLPQFWSRMSASVRRDELALILAATSYCAVPESGLHRGSVPRCTPHPDAFDWLAERTARLHAGDQRRRWVEILWSAADTMTLEHWQRQLGIATLPQDALLQWVPVLMASDLPWAEIERRLLTPGLMSLVGYRSEYGRLPFADDVVRGAAGRGQFDALARLIAAAGEHADGLHWEIVIAAAEAGDDANFEQLLRLLPADFPAGRWNAWLTDLLVVGASCPGLRPGSPQRHARIWERLRSAGFQPDRETFESLTSPASPGNQGACRIEQVPGEPYGFRAVRQGVSPPAQTRQFRP